MSIRKDIIKRRAYKEEYIKDSVVRNKAVERSLLWELEL